MMSMPFLILGSMCTYFYLQIRKARAAQSAAAVVDNRSAASQEAVGETALVEV